MKSQNVGIVITSIGLSKKGNSLGWHKNLFLSLKRMYIGKIFIFLNFLEIWKSLERRWKMYQTLYGNPINTNVTKKNVSKAWECAGKTYEFISILVWHGFVFASFYLPLTFVNFFLNVALSCNRISIERYVFNAKSLRDTDHVKCLLKFYFTLDYFPPKNKRYILQQF